MVWRHSDVRIFCRRTAGTLVAAADASNEVVSSLENPCDLRSRPMRLSSPDSRLVPQSRLGQFLPFMSLLGKAAGH